MTRSLNNVHATFVACLEYPPKEKSTHCTYLQCKESAPSSISDICTSSHAHPVTNHTALQLIRMQLRNPAKRTRIWSHRRVASSPSVQSQELKPPHWPTDTYTAHQPNRWACKPSPSCAKKRAVVVASSARRYHRAHRASSSPWQRFGLMRFILDWFVLMCKIVFFTACRWWTRRHTANAIYWVFGL